MSLIRYLWYLTRQVVGFAVGTRRPGMVLIVVVGIIALVVGLAVTVLAPVVIYPFI